MFKEKKNFFVTQYISLFFRITVYTLSTYLNSHKHETIIIEKKVDM